MTSRLKRKLERDGQEGDSNLNESFVQFGTPLPSLDKKDNNEFVPVWQQTVTDEKGRRRFHGAFTGGFSAGYWNTVGSKEGWTPTQFVSSRAHRAQANQSVQDFMDEEDLADLRSSQTIKTNDKYDPLSGEGAPAATEDRNHLLDMIRPGTLRIGQQLLAKMGWKPGQGVGPRVSWKARQRQAKELGLQPDQDAHMDDEASKHLYAPLDRPLALYPPKENAQGLGYIQSHASLPRSSRPAAPTGIQEGSKTMPVGGAFGISALEDADEDDLSVYDAGMAAHSHRLMELDDDDDASFPQVHSASKPRQPYKQAAKPPEATERFNDGTPTLPGFKLAAISAQPDPWFTPPDVPKDFQPNPKRVFDLSPLHSALPADPVPAHPSKPTQLNADSRAQILGEESIKAPPRSVFDFISKKNKERIAALAGSLPSDAASGTLPAPPAATAASIPLTVPPLDPTTAQAALKGFQPFGDNKNKQARYRFYLEAQAGLKSDQGVFAPSATPDRLDELNKELIEFQKAAMVFRPMSFAMSSRFTSGTSEQTAKDMQATTQPGLRFVSANKGDETEEASAPALEQPKQEEVTDPKVLAVRAGMFGPLTCTTKNFYPARLLCKRMNIQDPHPDGPQADDEDAAPANELLSKETMDSLREQGGLAPPPPPASSSQPKDTPKDGPRPLGSVGLGEDETQGRDTLTYEKPAMDLFKAIFAESEDESEDDEPVPPAAIPAVTEVAVQQGATPAQDGLPKTALAKADTSSYQPQPSAAPGLEPVSFADFKPTFVPKADRKTSSTKKDKKKSAAKAALSFDVDEGDLGAPVLKEKRKKHADKDRERKRHKSDKPKRVEEEEDEWVEKPPPPALAAPVQVVVGRPGRAKAADFL